MRSMRAFRAEEQFLVRAATFPRRASDSSELEPSNSEILNSAIKNLVFLECVAVASPSLRESLTQWESSSPSFSNARCLKLTDSVLKYMLRTRSRPTPFGLFAGVGSGRFSNHSSVSFGASRSSTKLDHEWLGAVIQKLETDRETLLYLTVVGHPALGTRAGRLVHPWPPTKSEDKEAPVEHSLKATAAVRAVLSHVGSPLPVSKLLTRLREAYVNVPALAWEKLVLELVTQDVLVTNLRPLLNGQDELSALLKILAGIDTPVAQKVAGVLRRVVNLRRVYDHTPLGEGEKVFDQMVSELRSIREQVTPLHIDLAFNLEIQMSNQVKQELEQALTVLWRLSEDRLGSRNLRAYHNDFLERYGQSRLVPLLELIDEDRGLGSPAGLLWPLTSDESSPPQAEDGKRARLLSALAVDPSSLEKREVEVTEEIVSRLERVEPNLQHAPFDAELYVQLVAASVSEVDQGSYRMVIGPNPGTHFGGATSGRFHDLLQPYERPLRRNDRTTDTLACVYMPRSPRAANVANTPVNADFVLNANSFSDPIRSGAVPVGFESVLVGADENGLYIVNAITGRRMRPVAHHVLDPRSQAPNAIRLLLEIGLEGVRPWEPFSWGPAEHLPFLPRVRSGRVILRSAQWRPDELIAAANLEVSQWDEQLSRWISYWNVPSLLLAVANDNRILLDLLNPQHRRLLRSLLKRGEAVILYEQPGGEGIEDSWLRSETGDSHVSEFVVTLSGLRSPLEFSPIITNQLAAAPKRFSLTGEWLYLKLFVSHKRQNEVLTQFIAPLVAKLRNENFVDQWFFLRYSENGAHLRLRFHGEAGKILRDVQPIVNEEITKLKAAGLVSRGEFCEYEPEWQRYGGPELQPALHDFFQADSDMSISVIRPDPARMPITTVMASSVLSIAAAFSTAFHEDPDSWFRPSTTSRDLTPLQRRDSKHTQRLIDPAESWASLRDEAGGSVVSAALAERADALGQFARAVRASHHEGTCWTDPRRISASLAHMTCNRLNGLAADERSAHALAFAAARSLRFKLVYP